MDNASKALLMAGSVLVAVLIISLGVCLFQSGSIVLNGTTDDFLTQAVTNYNQRYVNFIGGDISSSNTRSLMNSINKHNNNKEEVSTYGKIDKYGKTETKDIVTGKTYTIEVVHYSKQGAITGIKISEN